MPVIGIDHVQLAMPPEREDEARRFYTGVLGLDEVPKPPLLRDRGGVWFHAGRCELHLGVQSDFRPASKAHPALLVDDLEAFAERLERNGQPVEEAVPLDGATRLYTRDPFGNRLELIERHVSQT